MIHIKCIQPAFFDVDDTLLLWGRGIEGRRVTVKYNDLVSESAVAHEAHITKLKQHKARGHTVVVWSAGGSEWARQAVELLGLEDYVDLVIEKPMWLYDDLQPSQFMPRADWLGTDNGSEN